MTDLSARVALVTGGGRGIGRAIALRLSADGANIVINDLDRSAQAVADEIQAMDRKSLAVTADVTSADEVAAMVDKAVETFGAVDILVNNAGINRDQLLMRMTEEDWDRVLAVDLKSVFLCSRAVLKPMLKQRRGSIISISSIVGLAGNPGQANYAAAKAGIVGFTRATAREVASRGITVNAVAPGFIDTEMTQKLSDKQRQELMTRIPLSCLGTPQDVAAAVAFLASADARYINGQVLTVDGGLTMA